MPSAAESRPLRSHWPAVALALASAVVAILAKEHLFPGLSWNRDEPVYLWRVREGSDLSITQRRTEPKALRDRVSAVDSVSRFLAEHKFFVSKAVYDRSAIGQDLRFFLDVLPSADPEYRRLFLDLVTLTHEQYRYPWAKAVRAGFYLGRAAATFGTLRSDYEQVLPDLQRAYAIAKDWTSARFDPAAVARAELAWWVARRVPGQNSPDQVGGPVSGC